MSRRRVWAVASIALSLAGACQGDRGPHLAYDRGVPGDVRILAERTWERFLGAFPARRSCIPDLQLAGAWTLDDRARYSATSSTLFLRIPATAAQLETALVHEFAHHLEFHCPEHRALRPEFLRAQGLPGRTAWFEGETWETTPSELFAEATVEVVVGYRTIHRTLHITAESRDLIDAWGRGRSP